MSLSLRGLGLNLSVSSGGGDELTPLNMIWIGGQSSSTWARSDIAEIAEADRPDLTPANVTIWDVAGQDRVPLVYGPLSGGGNEQQPGNEWLDAAFQDGIGFDWSLIEELTVSGIISAEAPLMVFRWTRGGTLYDDGGAWGTDGDWRKAVAGSCYNDMMVEWAACVAALEAEGYTPNFLGAICDLGPSSAADASASSFDTDHATFVTNLRADIIGETCPFYQFRLSTKHQPGRANWATVRADHEAMALADPLFKLVNVDGMALLFDPASPTDDHPTAGFMEYVGRTVGLELAGVSHPQAELEAMGDPIYPIRNWKPGSLTNWKAGPEPWSDFPLHVNERTGETAYMISVNANEVPTLEKTTLANGLVRRAVVFDGSNDYIRGGLPAAIKSGAFIWCGAFKMASAANKTVYGEASTVNAQTAFIISNVSGNLGLFIRDDAGNLIHLFADLGVGSAFDGNWHFLAVTYDGTQFVGYKDGTTGSTPRAYTFVSGDWDDCNVASFGADFVNNVASRHGALTMGEAIISTYDAGEVAAYLAAKRAYFQREYGTP